MVNSLKGAKILVTGGTGFIGSHLVKELVKEKAEVTVPFIEIQPLSIFSLDQLSKKVNLQKADITRKDTIPNLIISNKIELIVHLAAQTLVTEAFKSPRETLETNIMGTANILEAARETAVKGIIVASSDKAYGKTKKNIYRRISIKRGSSV